MSPSWELLLGIVGGIASVAVILDYFGIKPNALAWGSIMALNQKWKLAMMLTLVGITLCFSGYGFYRSLRPKIVEKTVTVEKPVEKIVEKFVPRDCPDLSIPKSKTRVSSLSQRPSQPSQPTFSVTNPSGSIVNQDSAVQAPQTVNNYAPPARRLLDTQKSELVECLKQKPGQFSIAAIANDSEAYTYAQDLREVFISAGWEIKHKNIPINLMMIGGETWSGLHFNVHDVSTIEGRPALAEGSPEQNLFQCLNASHIRGKFIPFKDLTTGSVDVLIGETDAVTQP
jgi:hypothetical protein